MDIKVGKFKSDSSPGEIRSTYDVLPTAEKFKSDSSIFMANRSSDKNLVQIDQLLDQYHKINETTPSLKAIRQQVQLGMLFFACDHWLKLVDRGKKFEITEGGKSKVVSESANMNSRRRPVIFELYKCIVNTLQNRTGVPVNRLPDWLTATFGAQMGQHGAETDRGNQTTVYLDSETLMQYRLRFTGGRAYQESWWDNSRNLVLADSDTSIMSVSADVPSNKERLSGYVASVGRDFYMAPHFVNQRQQSFYHSSYLAGQPVMCSGTILIKNGEVKMITNNSGHYMPGQHNLAQAVEALGALGVPLGQLDVRVYPGPKPNVKATAFLSGVSFNLQDMQLENMLKEIDRNNFYTKDDAARAARANDSFEKGIQELVAHIKAAHKSDYDTAFKSRGRCETCKKHLNDGQLDDELFVALYSFAPKEKRDGLLAERRKNKLEARNKKLRSANTRGQ